MSRRSVCTILSLGALSAVFLLAGCGSGDPAEREESAIRAAISDYLRERRGINPDLMQMELSELQLDGDRARARVTFRSADSQDGISFEYQLLRNQGAWEVAASSGQGGGHGGGASPMPEGHPPTGEDPPPATQTEGS